jgi:glycosyltransferase involved in cell wall biosynthesis
MRILHIYKDFFPVLGGIENTMRVLAESQVAAGHEVTVLVCNRGFRSQGLVMNGVKVLKPGRLTTLASMPLSLRQLMLLSYEKHDVIHVHSPYPLGELGAWLLKRPTPYVITYHSDVVRQQRWLQLYGPLLRRVLQRATRIMPTSPRYIETSPWLAPVENRCTVVPLGVDPVRFSPPPVAFAGSPTLLFVGRLRYYKGLDTLLRALARLPGVRLTVVGSGPMEAEWRYLAESLGVSNRVVFLGEISDERLPSIYHQTHLFVLPANARAEAFGMVLLEAMASGLPCITTEVGTGTSWVVQDGVTGRVVPPRDPEALAGAIQSLLADSAQLHEMGRAARARVEAEFSLKRMSDRVMAVYEAVVRAPPS